MSCLILWNCCLIHHRCDWGSLGFLGRDYRSPQMQLLKLPIKAESCYKGEERAGRGPRHADPSRVGQTNSHSRTRQAGHFLFPALSSCSGLDTAVNLMVRGCGSALTAKSLANKPTVNVTGLCFCLDQRKMPLIDSFTFSVLPLGCTGFTVIPIYLLFNSQKC